MGRNETSAAPARGIKGWPQWKRHLAWSAFMLVMTGFLFWYFTDFESSKEKSRSMNWIVATLYNIGGKYLVCAACLAAAVGYAAFAWSDYRKQDQAATPDAAASTD